MMKRLTPLFRYFDQWAEEEYRLPFGSLALFRISYALYVLLIIGVPPFRWIGGKPDLFFDPPIYSVPYLFDGFPDPLFFWVLDLLIVLLFVFLLFGFKTRWTSWLLSLALFTGFSWSYAYGKINHDTLLISLVPLVMGFSDWGDYLSLDSRHASSKRERYWPVAMLALLLGFAMFSAGLPKLLSGWLVPSTHAVQGYTMRQYYDFFATSMLTPFMLTFDHPVFWELLDYGAVFLEIGFLLAVVRQPVFRFFVMLVVVFHLANCMMLNIEFSRNTTLYLLFIDWRPIMHRFYHKSWDKRIAQYLTIPSMAVVGVVLLIYYGIGLLAPFHLLLLPFGWDELTRDTIVIGLTTVFFTVNFVQSLLRNRASTVIHQ